MLSEKLNGYLRVNGINTPYQNLYDSLLGLDAFLTAWFLLSVDVSIEACWLSGGEGGIRTLDGVLAHTPLAGERFQPLSHLSNQ